MSPGKRVRPRPSTTSAFVTFNSDPPILLILPSSNSTLRCSNTCSPSKTRTSRMSCKVAGAWQRAAIADNHSQNIKTVDLMRLKSTVFIFWLWLSAIAARCQAPATLQLIRDVRVFDGEHVFEHRSVLLEDGKISRIGGSELKVTNAEVVDGRGRTLLPGLIDAHVHLPNPVEKASRQALVLGV